MEDLTFPEGSFDVVLSSLALHYVRDFGPLVENIFRWLTPGGTFVFSAEHPVFTAYGSQDWYYGPDGEILHFPVDNYYYEGERDAVFLGEHVVKYHRTLTTYLNTLLNCGFRLKTRGGAPAPGGHAGPARHAGRDAPAHDAAGVGGEAPLTKQENHPFPGQRLETGGFLQF